MSENDEQRKERLRKEQNARNLLEDMQVENRFVRKFLDKFNSFSVDDLKDKWGTSNSSEKEEGSNSFSSNTNNNYDPYKAEKELFHVMNSNDVIYGAMAGVVSFMFLRKFRVNLRDRFQKRMNLNNKNNMNSSNVNSNNPFHRADANITNKMNSKAEAETLQASTTSSSSSNNKNMKDKIFNIFTIVLDATVSLFIASEVSDYATDVDSIQNSLVKIPLVEGKSFISEELCPEAMKLYKEYPADFWLRDRTSDKLPSQMKRPMLNNITQFVLNCQRRALYEEQLLLQQQRGNNNYINKKKDSISIPSPGVPHDIQVDILSLYSNDQNSTITDINSKKPLEQNQDERKMSAESFNTNSDYDNDYNSNNNSNEDELDFVDSDFDFDITDDSIDFGDDED